MDRCKICHAEVKDNSEYCLNCKELGLDDQYLNTLSASMESLHSNKDITTTEEAEDYLTKNYSIFDMESESITDNKELKDLLNQTVLDERDNIEDSVKKIQRETDITELQQEIDIEERQEIDIKEQQEIELEGQDDASLENDVANLSFSELVTTKEDNLQEKEMLNISDSLENKITSNYYKEAEGEFVVGSTPDFDGNQDILDLLNEINRTPEDDSQEDYASDVLSIDDFMDNEESGEDPLLSLYGDSDDLLNPSVKDIGGIYQDALGGISSLEDVGIDEDLLKLIPDVPNQEEVQSKEIENLETNIKKNKKKNKEKNPTGRKKNIFARVFGNIKEELTEEEKEQLKQNVVEESKKKETETREAEKEKEATKAKKKADKLAAKKKAKDDAIKAKQAKVERAKAKKEEKERLSKEVQELIDEIDENEGRINRIGASFVFALFASIALFVVIGTNVYSYAINIQNATKNFGMQRYNDAYNEVYGLEIRDEDIEIYDKIMTVMFVNKQLNSYNNYSAIGMYPEALDSLLKGLERYDKYYALAMKLGIQTDLDYVRNQIVKELDNIFYLSVEEAYNIINSPTQLDYSVAVYNVVLEHLDDKLVQKTENDK